MKKFLIKINPLLYMLQRRMASGLPTKCRLYKPKTDKNIVKR